MQDYTISDTVSIGHTVSNELRFECSMFSQTNMCA